MSAIGLSDPCLYPAPLISAHADYRRSDFVFSRTQSPALRAAPWESRIKPLRSWGQIGIYSVAAMAAAVLATALI